MVITRTLEVWWNGNKFANQGLTVKFLAGISPGSMPPHSKSLADEGAAFKSFLLVDGGVFNENEIVKELTTPCGTASCGK